MGAMHAQTFAFIGFGNRGLLHMVALLGDDLNVMICGLNRPDSTLYLSWQQIFDRSGLVALFIGSHTDL